MNNRLKFLKKILFALISFFAFTINIWAADYVYYEGEWYEYEGSTTLNEENLSKIVEDIKNDTDKTPSTFDFSNNNFVFASDYTFSDDSFKTIQNSCKVYIPENITLTIANGEQTLHKAYIKGNIIINESSSLAFAVGGNELNIAEGSKITNKGTLTFSQKIENYGTIINKDNSTLEMSDIDNYSVIENYGTYSVDNNNIRNYGLIKNYASITVNVMNIMEGGTLNNYEGSELSANSNFNNDGTINNEGEIGTKNNSLENNETGIINNTNGSINSKVNNKGELNNSNGNITGEVINEGNLNNTNGTINGNVNNNGTFDNTNGTISGNIEGSVPVTTLLDTLLGHNIKTWVWDGADGGDLRVKDWLVYDENGKKTDEDSTPDTTGVAPSYIVLTTDLNVKESDGYSLIIGNGEWEFLGINEKNIGKEEISIFLQGKTLTFEDCLLLGDKNGRTSGDNKIRFIGPGKVICEEIAFVKVKDGVESYITLEGDVEFTANSITSKNSSLEKENFIIKKDSLTNQNSNCTLSITNPASPGFQTVEIQENNSLSVERNAYFGKVTNNGNLKSAEGTTTSISELINNNEVLIEGNLTITESATNSSSITVSNQTNIPTGKLTNNQGASVFLNGDTTIHTIENRGSANLSGTTNTITNFSNYGTFTPAENSTLNIVSEISNNEEGLFNAENITVNITGPAGSIIGNGPELTRFGTLSVNNSQTLSFSNDIYVKTLRLSGAGEDGKLTIASPSENPSKIYISESQGTGRFLSLDSSSIPSIVDENGIEAGYLYSVEETNVSVEDVSKADEQINLLKKGWLVTDSTLYVWDGDINTDLTEPSNWHLNKAPKLWLTAEDDPALQLNACLIIPSLEEGNTNYPEINTPIDITCKLFDIDDGAKLTIDTSDSTNFPELGEEKIFINVTSDWKNFGTVYINDPHDKISLTNFANYNDNGTWHYYSGSVYNGDFHYNVTIDGDCSIQGDTSINNELEILEGKTLTINSTLSLLIPSEINVGEGNIIINESTSGTPHSIKKETEGDLIFDGVVENHGTISVSTPENSSNSNNIIFNNTVQNYSTISATKGNITFNSEINIGSAFSTPGSTNTVNYAKVEALNGEIIINDNLNIFKPTVFQGNTNLTNENTNFSCNNSLFFFHNPKPDEENRNILKLKDGTNISKLYFAGNVDINVGSNGTGTLTTEYLAMEIPSPDFTSTDDFYIPHNFTANIYGNVNSGNNTLTEKGINITRCSKTDNIIGTINFNGTITNKNITETHSGTTTNILETFSFTTDKFIHSSDNSTPKSELSINGDFSSNEIDLCHSFGTTLVTVGNNGKIETNKLFNSRVTEFNNEGADKWITNNGIISTSESFTIPSGYVVENTETGTIQILGGSYENANVDSDGTTPSLLGGTFEILGNAEINGSNTFNKVNIVRANSIFDGSNTFNDLIIHNTSTDESPVTSPITITFKEGETQTINNKLEIKGELKSLVQLRSSVEGNIWNINAPSDSQSDEEKVSIVYADVKDSTSTNPIYVETSNDSGNNTNWYFFQEFHWNGNGNSWEVEPTSTKNWSSMNYATGVETEVESYPQNEAHIAIVGIIPGDTPNYPIISTEITIKKLIIGEENTNPSVTPSVTITDNDLRVTDGFTNYGKVIYTKNGRITNNEQIPLPINDTANDGTVEYKSDESDTTIYTITEFSEGLDYHNVIISSGNWEINSEINTYNFESLVENLSTSKDITSSNNLTINCLEISDSISLTSKNALIKSNILASSEGLSLSFVQTGTDETDKFTFQNETLDTPISLGSEPIPFSSLSFSESSKVDFISPLEIYADTFVVNFSLNLNNKTEFFTDNFSANKQKISSSENAELTINKKQDSSLATFGSENDDSVFTNKLKSLTLNIKSTIHGNNEIENLTINEQSTFTGDNTFTNVNIFASSTFTNSNSFDTLSIVDNSDEDNLLPQITVKFAEGATQKVSSKFKVLGFENQDIILTSTSSSPNVDDTSSWWTLESSDSCNFDDFQNVSICYSTANPKIERIWPTSVKENPDMSTFGWFLRGFYWYGIENTSWNTPANWSTTKDDYTPCSTSPNYEDGISEINIIQLSQDNKILKLENNINIKSLIVEENAQMDLAACSVTSQTITNEGTIKLEGNEGQNINATITNKDGSCIEYYGSSIKKLAWGENYENLSFTNEAASESTLNANVNGQLIIQNSNCEGGKSLSLNVNLSESASPIQIGYKDEAKDIVAGNVVIQSQEGSHSLSLADNILCKNLTINSPVINAGELSIYGNLTLSENSSIEATRLSLYGNLNVDSENPITMNSEFILYGNSTGSTEFTVNNPNFTIKSFIIKTDTDIPLNINSTQTSNISENFVILSTNMNLKNQGAFSIGKDLIILGENYNIDDTYNDTQTGYNSINKYNQKRDSACNFDLDTLLNTMSWTDFSSTITAENNFTFTIGKNFYCNGATLKGTSDSSKITLSIYDTKVFNKCFAEAYHSSIDYCDVTSRNDSSNPSKIPAYNCNISNPANWDNEDFTIEYIHSVSDNIIEIKFSQPLKNINPLLNIINEGITQRPHFNNIYSDITCSTLITDDIISDPFYLKAKETWNTDANGESAGHTSSTDKSGNHKDIVLSLDIPSAIEYKDNGPSTFLIRNQYGKRLKNYSIKTPTQTEAFKDVEDKVGPVLIGVKTGQELHIEPEENILLQKSYDAHNFIEFLYSEAVKFITEDEATNNLLNTDLYAPENADKIIQNVMVKDELGAISGDISQENNLTFAGLGVIEKGLVHTGSTDAAINGKYVNALYRENMHSLKISIAGLTSGNEITTENNVKYQNWIGYIEEAILPSGKITEYFTDNTNKTNSNISDFKGNQLQKNNIPSENFLVDNSENNIYGDWDTQGPSFVPYRSDETAWTSALYENGFEAESIGRSIGNGSYLTHIEFHLFDNKPAFNAEDEAQWFSEIGWCKLNTNTPELLINNAAPNNLDNSYSADIFGGARPFVSKEYRTRGGIRYSSLINSSQGFKYSTDDSLPSKTFGNSIYAGASGFIFTGSSNPRRAANQKEGLHFGLSLTEQYSHKTTFTISYDQTKATITDLAGNKLKSATFKTKDRTPPSFYLTLSPVSQKEIYIIIMQKLLTESSDIKYITNDGETKELDEPYLQILPDCFEIISIDQTGQASVNPNGNLQIDYSKAAEIMPQSNDDFTVLKLYLTKDVNLADIQNLYIRVKNPAGFDVSSTDPVTNTKNAGVSFIQNRKYNYIEINTAHAISDFAINAIMPSYAYNIIEEEDLSSLTDVASNSDQLRSITDWDRDQLLLGSLLLEKPISLFANVKGNLGENGGALEGNNISQIKMYLSNKADSNSLSNVINNNFENLNWRIWLPQITENNYTSPIFNTIALQNNSNFKEVLATSTNEDESIALAQEVSFNLNQDLLKNFKENTQLSFLFGFMDDNNQQIKIIPEPLLDFENLGHYDLDSSLKYPLLSLRLENPMDIFSLDLWSFKLLTSHSQRGGVSILNNVINPLNNEETTIKLNLSQANNINIMVMTLDGNIITYLCKSSELSAGEHTFYWNGKNKANKAVARGLYFIRIIGKNIDETRKVMVVK